MSRAVAASYYAVRVGRARGIYRSWPECEAQVKGYSGARFKKFASEHAADDFLRGLVRDTRPLGAPKRNTTKKKKGKGKEEVISDPAPGTRLVWTDGACSHNGTAKARAGVGVYFGDGDVRNVSEPLPGPVQTNQRAEMQAIIRALEVLAAEGPGPVQVRTDSKYVLRGLHEWLPVWKRAGWRTSQRQPVKNRDLWEHLDALQARFADVTLVHVRGHSGIHGNVQADRLAVAGCESVLEEVEEIEEL